ncbi:MAG: HNH endonuclease, partial [Actinobacteria bacterium]|nr:HNH endonuclease [Actinomycetota bacterium]
TPEWLLALSLSASQEREYKGLVQNIGNLALLNRGQNSGIKQKPWVDPTWPNAREQSKRAAYNNADFDITKDLAVIESWDEEVILRREVWILKTVKEVFNPYSGSPELYVPFS